jgi:hypothetical protein
MATRKKKLASDAGTPEASSKTTREAPHTKFKNRKQGTLAAALNYAKSRSWYVFPVPPGTKKSHKDAEHSNGRPWGMTNDPDEIRQDFAQWPAAGIGIPTGPVNNIWVMEADTPKGHAVDGLASRKQLEATYGPLPDTFQVISPTGSLHDYWQWPDDGTVIRNSTSKIAAGIDVRGVGGMVLAPPTLRPGVGVYRVGKDVPIAKAPAWLIELATRDDGGDRVSGDEPEAEPTIVAAAMAVIPNDDVDWENWNRVAMACWRATGGSEEGFAAFDAWSQKSSKYDAATTRERWAHLHRSPPTSIGFGTLWYLAMQADGDWLRRYDNELMAMLRAANRRGTTTAKGKGKATDTNKQDQASGDDKPAPGDGEPKKDDAQPTPEPMLVYILELARKLWGEGQKISKGQWRFGANNEIAVDAFRAKWFNLTTGAHGGLTELEGMVARLYAGSAQDTSSVILVRATDVVPRAKNWLWEGHLLRGALELLTGIPGLGKSQVQCTYVACATTGRAWPGSGKGLVVPVSVIMVTAEDPLDQEVVPRLIAAGADLSRVHFLQYIKTDEKQRQFLLAEDLDRIKKAITEIGDVGLITMDPITAYMGGKMDSHKVTEVRSQLGPLKDFSQEVQTAVSAITHPAKNPGRRAIDHFIASQAFIAAARVGHACFAEMKQDEATGENKPTGRVLFTHAKHNPSERMGTLAYRIIGGVAIGQDPQTRAAITSSHVVWEQAPVDISPDAAVAASDGKSKRESEQAEVQTFLRSMLAAGSAVQQEIMDEGERLGFSQKQIRTAARKLKVVMKKSSFKGPWQWYWPDAPNGDVM